MEIRRILCPVDFSQTAAHAVEHAAAFTRWSHASLTILHVSPSEQDLARDETARFVASVSRDAAADIVVDVGSPVAAILHRAATMPADLIVMGTHGAGGFERLILGSVAEKVLRKATCPVLTVPPHAYATSRLPPSHVLCAVDFSEWSLAAVELASWLAERSGAALDLLHVVEWPWPEPPPPHFAELPPERAAALLEYRRYVVDASQHRLVSLVSDHLRDRSVVTTTVCHGKPYVETLRLAAENSADLIVLGVHSRSAVDLTMFGSTTHHVVRRATCPVLTVRR